MPLRTDLWWILTVTVLSGVIANYKRQIGGPSNALFPGGQRCSSHAQCAVNECCKVANKDQPQECALIGLEPRPCISTVGGEKCDSDRDCKPGGCCVRLTGPPNTKPGGDPPGPFSCQYDQFVCSKRPRPLDQPWQPYLPQPQSPKGQTQPYPPPPQPYPQQPYPPQPYPPQPPKGQPPQPYPTHPYPPQPPKGQPQLPYPPQPHPPQPPKGQPQSPYPLNPYLPQPPKGQPYPPQPYPPQPYPPQPPKGQPYPPQPYPPQPPKGQPQPYPPYPQPYPQPPHSKGLPYPPQPNMSIYKFCMSSRECGTSGCCVFDQNIQAYRCLSYPSPPTGITKGGAAQPNIATGPYPGPGGSSYPASPVSPLPGVFVGTQLQVTSGSAHLTNTSIYQSSATTTSLEPSGRIIYPGSTQFPAWPTGGTPYPITSGKSTPQPVPPFPPFPKGGPNFPANMKCLQ